MIDEEAFPEDSYNADDPAEVNSARKKAAREKLNRDSVIREMMSVKEIRKLFAEILTFCDVHGNPHVPGDPYSTAFNAGMANAGKFVWDLLKNGSPKFFFEMLKEVDLNDKQQD